MSMYENTYRVRSNKRAVRLMFQNINGDVTDVI